MKYTLKTSVSGLEQNILLAVFEKAEQLALSAQGQIIDKALNGAVSQFLKTGDVSAKIGDVALFHHENQRIFLVGAGSTEAINERQYQQIIKATLQAIKKTKAEKVTNALTDIELKNRDIYWNIRFAIETIEATNYQFTQFKSKTDKNDTALCELEFVTEESIKAQQAITHGQAIALGVKITRDVANCPPNICTPTYLSQQAELLSQQNSKVRTTILGEQAMAELKMNAYLGVSQGSKNEAKLTIMEFRNHSNANAKPLVFVGKGLTFDAGGISLKPSAEMDEMKYDMCGAAAVLGLMNAVAELDLQLNIIGVMAGCENLPDGNAYRPGDILTTMNGLTVEVLNTDAEGRLVLCDTLTYVERFEPEAVIDIATLTGACVVALGQHNSGLVSTHDDLAQALFESSQQAFDKAWQLPLSEEYQEQLKSPFADLANIGGRWGGAITAGAFLSNFTKNYPWAHLDIAGTAWLQGANKGATGRPVGLLVQYLLNRL